MVQVLAVCVRFKIVFPEKESIPPTVVTPPHFNIHTFSNSPGPYIG